MSYIVVMGGKGHCPVRSSISSLLILRAKQAKEWMMKNAIKDQSTGCIIPGQVLLHPDGKTLFILCSPNNGIRHYCLSARETSALSRPWSSVLSLHLRIDIAKRDRIHWAEINVASVARGKKTKTVLTICIATLSYGYWITLLCRLPRHFPSAWEPRLSPCCYSPLLHDDASDN